MTESVISGPFVFIAEHLVGFGCLLEFLFGRFVSGVTIGMVLHGDLAVGLFDLSIFGSFAYSKNFIVISLCHIAIAYLPTTTLA